MKKFTVLLAATLLLFSSCEPGQVIRISTESKIPVSETESSGDRMIFNTKTLDGQTFGSADLKDAKLVMVNFFEPWCGPCIREMPDIEKLYSEYKNRGLAVVGVFYSEGMDDSVREVVSTTGVTYPIVRGNSELEAQMSAYVPTTFFMDGDGRVIESQIIGAKDYETWKGIIEGLLE